MIKKYGKSSEGLLNIKKSFFVDNDAHLEKQRRINEVYLRQPPRTRCKNCASPVSAFDFESHSVRYKLCPICHHLNGMHVETDEFFYEVYHRDAGKSYGANYDDKRSRDDYAVRVRAIYRPKAAFLRECLIALGVHRDDVRVCDFGAGSGFLVAGLREEGFDARGLEVSAEQVALGNSMLEAVRLATFDPAETLSTLAHIDCEILAMIGVLEHLPDPRAALAAIHSNPRIEHVYLSVPLLGPAVFFEVLFQRSFNRHLGGAHTHLYSPQSIEHFCREFGFTLRASWLFGTDMMDLYRHAVTTLKKDGVSDAAIGSFEGVIVPLIDSLQLCIDQASGSSEGHFLLSK